MSFDFTEEEEKLLRKYQFEFDMFLDELAKSFDSDEAPVPDMSDERMDKIDNLQKEAIGLLRVKIQGFEI